MTVREMHIELDQSLQQIAAHRTRKYMPEEKDWILNKMQNRLIQSCIRPNKDGTGGFEIDQLGVDMLRNLIVSGVELVPYIDPGKNRYMCFLPADYSNLLSDWSFTTLLCTSVPANTATDLLDVYAIKQVRSEKESAPYYETVTVAFGDSIVTVPDDLPYANKYTGYNRKEDISLLAPWIAPKGNYYWEQLGDIYRPGHYLLLVPYGSTINTSITVDGTDYTDYEIVVGLELKHHTGNGSQVDNRLTPSNKVSSLNATAFYKSSHYSPISEIKGKLLYIYNDSSFTVSKVGISYIRKALPISLSLGTDSELPEGFHQQICDLAIEYMKGRLENVTGQQLAENDNNTRVKL